MFAFVADGAHGRHGVDGHHGGHGSYGGGRGGDGGDATASTPGLRAGEAVLVLETLDSGIRVFGSAVGGVNNVRTDTCVEPGRLGQIVMSAVGGTGGNGADGGAGGRGGDVRFVVRPCRAALTLALVCVRAGLQRR